MSQHSYSNFIISYFGKNKKKTFGKILSILQKLNSMHAIFIYLITHACHHFAVKIGHFTPSNKKVEAFYPLIYDALLLVDQCIVVRYLLSIIIMYVLTVVYRTTLCMHNHIQYSRLYYWLTFNEISNSRLITYTFVSYLGYFHVVCGNHTLCTCKRFYTIDHATVYW